MADNIPALGVETLFLAAAKLPYCRIDREEYLRKELQSKVHPQQLASALAHGTVNAGVPLVVLDHAANGAISNETANVTLLSAAAGFPGGLGIIAAAPADLAQYYAHVFRIAQKLAYLYGANEVTLDDSILKDLMIYLGVMFGVQAANAALNKLAAANAVKIGTRVAAKPLTKHAAYTISKKLLAVIGVKLTKASFGKVVAKSVPVIGALFSGGLSLATFLPMAHKLKNHLAELAAMSPEELSAASIKADTALAEFMKTPVESHAKAIEEGLDEPLLS